ncbi:hypothetical protein MS2017_0664 [Bathymodiolus thermophilus thioautotrophic gill symbiont]|uniref:Uncharacterized protein n=1 Tax=Bathymodiolus thermophilus thioautotrophic gill symbiont TaxID=2360 RepID=A0A3G3IKM4_9GAMM|nr:hypothetical protein MS2017_0664 [Bathymodiolus thermophilus thioautotrophic gill symbiont]
MIFYTHLRKEFDRVVFKNRKLGVMFENDKDILKFKLNYPHALLKD